MRTIKHTSAFKRDVKREKKGRYRDIFNTELLEIINCLANDIPLHSKYRDHQLKGSKSGYRECHIRPDLLLLYRLVDGELDLIILTRLGSHSEILDL